MARAGPPHTLKRPHLSGALRGDGQKRIFPRGGIKNIAAIWDAPARASASERASGRGDDFGSARFRFVAGSWYGNRRANGQEKNKYLLPDVRRRAGVWPDMGGCHACREIKTG